MSHNKIVTYLWPATYNTTGHWLQLRSCLDPLDGLGQDKIFENGPDVLYIPLFIFNFHLMHRDVGRFIFSFSDLRNKYLLCNCCRIHQSTTKTQNVCWNIVSWIGFLTITCPSSQPYNSSFILSIILPTSQIKLLNIRIRAGTFPSSTYRQYVKKFSSQHASFYGAFVFFFSTFESAWFLLFFFWVGNRSSNFFKACTCAKQTNLRSPRVSQRSLLQTNERVSSLLEQPTRQSGV